jgi:hypothetical protein
MPASAWASLFDGRWPYLQVLDIGDQASVHCQLLQCPAFGVNLEEHYSTQGMPSNDESITGIDLLIKDEYFVYVVRMGWPLCKRVPSYLEDVF